MENIYCRYLMNHRMITEMRHYTHKSVTNLGTLDSIFWCAGDYSCSQAIIHLTKKNVTVLFLCGSNYVDKRLHTRCKMCLALVAMIWNVEITGWNFVPKFVLWQGFLMISPNCMSHSHKTLHENNIVSQSISEQSNRPGSGNTDKHFFQCTAEI